MKSRTFLELDEQFSTKKTSRFVIVPIPYDGTVCFQKGTALGPQAILDVSDQMEHIDEEIRKPIYLEGIYTAPPIRAAKTPEAMMRKIEKNIRSLELFSEERFPIILGGEHSITAPIIRVAAERYPDLSVLHFDAHSDLRNEFGAGGIHSHAAVMRRVLEVTPHLVQVGIRSFSETDLGELSQQADRFITPQQVEQSIDRVIKTILSRLTDRVYISIDIDVLDPAFAPGVGTPEPGGLNWFQLLRIVRTVCQKKTVIGADVVETMPLGNKNKITEFTAARLVGKLIAYNLKP